MTWKDKIIEEVGWVREEHVKKFNYYISAICADIRQKQAASKHKVIISIERKVTEKETSDLLQTT